MGLSPAAMYFRSSGNVILVLVPVHPFFVNSSKKSTAVYRNAMQHQIHDSYRNSISHSRQSQTEHAAERCNAIASLINIQIP